MKIAIQLLEKCFKHELDGGWRSVARHGHTRHSCG